MSNYDELVRRLRADAEYADDIGDSARAADAIIQLQADLAAARAERDKLREVLQESYDLIPWRMDDQDDEVIERIEAALAKDAA